MTAITLFTWGYYGWGNATPHLIEAVDAVKTSRGFEPPLFVDIRIRRTVRAKGFQGDAFEKQLGPTRHRWMKSLGNRFIQTRTGPNIQIADPSAADELLDLALESAGHKQRVLFFCSCQWPRCDGEIACHRATVAGLVLAAAKKRAVPVEVVEWPDEEPRHIDLEVTAQVFSCVRKGRLTVLLGNQPNLAEVARIPWCSIATIRSNSETLHRLVGPAIRQKDQWSLPVLFNSVEPGLDLPESRTDAKKLRQGWGLEAASA
jgi:hypothetical protein